MSAALAINDTLDRELPAIMRQVREPAKVIAFKAGMSKRSVEAIRQAEHGISAHALLALASKYPEVKALVIKLIGGVEDDPSWLMAQLQKHISAKVKSE